MNDKLQDSGKVSETGNPNQLRFVTLWVLSVIVIFALLMDCGLEPTTWIEMCDCGLLQNAGELLK